MINIVGFYRYIARSMNLIHEVFHKVFFLTKIPSYQHRSFGNNSCSVKRQHLI